MSSYAQHFCSCKDCKKARKNGKVLGGRRYTFWYVNPYNNAPELYTGKCDAYVPYHRWQDSRRPDPKFDKRNFL